MDIFKFIIKRLLLSLLVIFGISVITFLVIRLVPSDPASVYLGPRPTVEQVEMVTKELGLDKPLVTQYGIYATDLLKGDFGESLRTHRPVSTDMLRLLPNTLELLMFAMIVAILIGIPLGLASAFWQGKWPDHLSRVVSIIGVSSPNFWIALIFQVLFFSILGLLPVSGQLSTEVELLHPIQTITNFNLVDAVLTGNWVALQDTIPHYVLPVLAISLHPLGLITRMTRSNVLDVLQSDYIKLSKAHGISNSRILFHYALKNALGPILTVSGLMFAFSIMGAFFVEIIFNWPGIGNYAVQSILAVDTPAIMGITILIATIYVVINMVIDILQSLIDPRIVIK